MIGKREGDHKEKPIAGPPPTAGEQMDRRNETERVTYTIPQSLAGAAYHGRC